MTNPLASVDQLYRRAAASSSSGGLPTDLQDTVFFATQCLTQAAGLLLRLPQTVTAQANVILARYWLVEPPMALEFSVSRLPFVRPRRRPAQGAVTSLVWAKRIPCLFC